MAIQGEIKTLYTDSSKERVLLPVTKTKAITDDQGINLDVLLASKASESFVTNKIAEAQLGGGESGDIDLSGYATKDELNTAKGEINQTIAALDYEDVISSTLPTNKGGTGHDFSNIPKGAVIRNSADNTGLWYTQTASGALYATASNVNPTFGTLPIAQGGTGAVNADTARTNLGLGYKIIREVSGLGLTGTQTITQVFSAMPNYSVMYITHSSTTISDAPTSYCLIELVKAGKYGFAKATQINSTTPRFYEGSWYDGTFSGWRQSMTTVLTQSVEYGTALPAAGTKGRIFFKKV